LDDFKKATSKIPRLTSADDLVVQISSTILDLEEVGGILRNLASQEANAWTKEEFAELTGAVQVIELIYNSAFVRAAARTGAVFYLGPDQRVYRLAVNGTATHAVSPTPAGEVDEDYYVRPDWYADLRQFINDGSPTLLIGPPGAGKSEACEQIFLEREQTLHIISCTPSMTADDLEGRVELRSKDGVAVTQFEPAELAIAAQEGHGVLLDDADAIPAHAAFGAYRLLAGKDMRILRMGRDGRVPRHDEFRIVGTQNTEGRGDDRGLYHGRAYQDEAFLDRWENTIRVDYLPEEVEADVITHKTGIDATSARLIVDAARLLRRAQHEDEIIICCTMRRTLAVARNLARGHDIMRAWSFGFINRATREDVRDIVTLLERVYGSSWKGSKPKKRKIRPRRRGT
jgi:MoxR-like ATPase